MPKKKLTAEEKLAEMRLEVDELKLALAWIQQQVYDLRFKRNAKGH